MNYLLKFVKLKIKKLSKKSKSRYIRTVSTTRLKFSNSKIAYKNILIIKIHPINLKSQFRILLYP